MTDPAQIPGMRIDRRKLLKATGVLGLGGMTGLLAACGNGNGASGDGDSEEPTGELSSMTDIELTVSHWPDLLYSPPWAAALEQGFFEANNLNVTGFVGSAGGGTTVRNVVTGGVPVGQVATPAAINAYLAGAPLVIIGGSIQNTSEINFVTLPDTGITSIDDVRGKRVGYTSPGSVTEGCAVLSLLQAGIDLDEVELVGMGGFAEAHTGLREGAIDVAPHLLPTYLMQEDEGWELLWWTNEVIGDFMQQVLIAGAQVIEEQPELIQAVVDSYRQGIDAVVEDPASTAAAWAENSEVPEEAALASLEQIDVEAYYGTRLNPEGLSTTIDQMRAIDLLGDSEEVDWEQLIDQRFLPDDEHIDLSTLG